MVNPVRNKHGPFKEETEPKRHETKQMERNETIHNVFWLLAAFFKMFCPVCSSLVIVFDGFCLAWGR